MKCPKCGEEMEKGYFSIIGSAWNPAGNVWSSEKPGYNRFLIRPKIPSGDFIKIMDVRKDKYVRQGFRCPKCKIIVFSYVVEKEEDERG